MTPDPLPDRPTISEVSPPSAQATPEAPRPLSAFDVPLRMLAFADIGQWLGAGARDFRQAPLIGLFYGACFVSMGWALLAVFEHAPAYVLALSAGFLLVGPFMCMGLYRVSQRLERGEPAAFVDSLLAWRIRTGTLAIFAFTLLVLEMLWGRVALVIFAVSFDGMPDFKGSLLKLADASHLGFIVAYLSAGAVFAGLIFAVSVVSIPLILDRPVDAITAALTSFRLVLTQAPVMLAWGAVITVLVTLALLPWFLGLLIIGPVVGHATWHAYRAAVGSPGA
jgi:uncharacterized membrane protein